MSTLDSALTISGRLVALRPISREDYAAIFAWRSSIESGMWAMLPAPPNGIDYPGRFFL